LISFASCLALMSSRRVFTYYLRPMIRKSIPLKEEKGKERSEEEIEKVAEKVENHFFDAIFYFVSAYYGWLICKDYDWFPTYLGGNGDLANSFTDLPFAKYDAQLPTYAFLTFGFRIESFITCGFLREHGNDYMEMLFHDIVTIFLFLGYIYGHWMPIGTLIVIVHDITDSPIHISKGLYSTKLADTSTYIFVIAQLMWLYLRLYAFPRIIYQLSQSSYPADREQFNGIVPLCVGFLMALQCLHVLWFMMFQRINLAVIRKARGNILSDVGHIGSDSPSATKDVQSEDKNNFSSEAKAKTN